MMRYSPLRYPGGKGKISSFFSELFVANNLIGGTYIEPYVGGGSIALSLLINGVANQIIINDKEYPIRNKGDYRTELLSLGFSTFFLNRTNRSGIIKGGVIGGLNQTGNYLIDARYNSDDLKKRIKLIALYKDKIELHNLDAVELIHNLQSNLPNNSLFYFDPPYYKKGKGLYMNYYDDQDHRDIYNAIAGLENIKWVVTYDKEDFILDLYLKFRMYEYSLNYCAATVGKGQEYMIFSDNCIVPEKSSINFNKVITI